MQKRAFVLIFICLLLAGCGKRPDETPHRRTVFAMDTVMNLTVYGENGDKALDAAEQDLRRLDALLARGAETSAVHTLNQYGFAEDEETAALLEKAGEISAATGGAFDATLGKVLDLWGFGSGAGDYRVPPDAELDAALAAVGMERVFVDGEEIRLAAFTEVDLGGIVKGYACERMFDRMKENGVVTAVFDLGGDVALWGGKSDGPWRVAIKDPEDEGAFLGILETDGGRFIMTSGVYERYFEENGARYHHILDPKTGRPADSDLVSATVVCQNGIWADALATACCVVGADGALALRERLADTMPFDLILITDDARALYTCEGFAPETNNGYAYEKVA